MADDNLDIEDVADTGDYFTDDEEDVDMDEVEEQEQEQEQEIQIVDFSATRDQMKAAKIKRTNPYMTKFERTKLIGYRASQLSKGAPPTVSVGGMTDVSKIATKELLERTMPLMVRRPLPDKTYEDWTLDELIF